MSRTFKKVFNKWCWGNWPSVGEKKGSVDKDVEQLDVHLLLLGIQNRTATVEKHTQYLMKLNIYFTPREMKT